MSTPRARWPMTLVLLLVVTAIVCVALFALSFRPTREKRLRWVLDPAHVQSIRGEVLDQRCTDRTPFVATPQETAEFIEILRGLPPVEPCNCTGVGILDLTCVDGQVAHVLVMAHMVEVVGLGDLKNDGRLDVLLARIKQRVTGQPSSSSSAPSSRPAWSVSGVE